MRVPIYRRLPVQQNLPESTVQAPGGGGECHSSIRIREAFLAEGLSYVYIDLSSLILKHVSVLWAFIKSRRYSSIDETDPSRPSCATRQRGSSSLLSSHAFHAVLIS
jgi:hypothetical protein